MVGIDAGADYDRAAVEAAFPPAVVRILDAVEKSFDAGIAERPVPPGTTATNTLAVTALVDALIEVVIRIMAEVQQADENLRAEIAELRARVDAMEKRGFNYRGIWRRAETYPEGCFVTDHGGLWHANRQTDRRPGDGDSGWVLAVKAGRAPRDVKSG